VAADYCPAGRWGRVSLLTLGVEIRYECGMFREYIPERKMVKKRILPIVISMS